MFVHRAVRLGIHSIDRGYCEPAQALKPDGEKPTKTALSKDLRAAAPTRSGKWGCTKYKEVKICN